MIDHVSIAVRDLAASAGLYDRVLAPLGLTRLVERPATVGFGKRDPEFWLNLRAGLPPISAATGSHACYDLDGNQIEAVFFPRSA
jgi:catechol 2,3-dioxygenase-like lactoylglutathione lyase family enzyme